MTEEKILEGNKAIAEFMGGEWIKDDYNEWGYKIKTPHWNKLQKPEALQYHSSWDWLMPVVDKIMEIDITPVPNWTGYRMEIVPRGYVKINGFPMPPIFRNVSIEGSLINATWYTVVDFITWYNTQNPTTKAHE